MKCLNPYTDQPQTVIIAKDLVGSYFGKKMEGNLISADEKGFVVVVPQKQKVEGKKRPQIVDVEMSFGYDDVKWVKAVIDFK